MATDNGASAVEDVVERAVRDKELDGELSGDVGVRILHSGETLTMLHVVMDKRPADAGNPIPHNHLMWAVIGLMHGGEANEFFKQGADTLESCGGRVLSEGDVLMLGEDTIHSVKNPSSDHLSSALHVYGGSLIAAPKTMWCEPDHTEQPFDLLQVLAS